MLRTILPDLSSMVWYEAIFFLAFGFLCLCFSFIDVSYYTVPGSRASSSKLDNDRLAGVAEWKRNCLALSGAASWTGALCVVLIAKGKYSSYFWGFWNTCTLAAVTYACE